MEYEVGTRELDNTDIIEPIWSRPLGLGVLHMIKASREGTNSAPD